MTAYYNDFEPTSVAWLRELIKAGLIADGVVDDRSILDVQPEDLKGFTQCHFFAGIGGWSYALRLAGVPDDMEVWTGSPPCQPFSAAGLQKGKDDARHLAPKFASLVRTARPALLFGEQVASAAVFGPSPKGNRPGFEGTPPWAWLDDLSDRLEAARYAVWANDVPAAGVGAPHIRQRTFFGAVRLADPAGAGLPVGRAGSGRAPGSVEQPERLRDADRMADAASAGPLPSPHGGLHRGQEGAGPRDAEPERSGDAGSVEHATGDGRLEWRAGADGRGAASGRGLGGRGLGGLADRDDAGLEGRGKPECECPAERAAGPDGVAGRVADADGRDTRAEREQPGGQQRQQPQDSGRGVVDDCRRPGPANGVWRDADWLYCRDGKWRPVEPGTFPLAARVPNRVGLLRGYGNAIVPEAAQAFIEASLEALDDVQRLRLMSDLAGDVFG